MQLMATLSAAFFIAAVSWCAFAQNDSASVSATDQDFMKKAAQANIAEIETGKLAQKRADSEEIRQLGATMQQEHGKVLDELLALAKSNGVSLLKTPDDEHKALAKTLAGASRRNFDRTCATAAGVADHTAAKQLFEKGAKGKDPEVSDPEVSDFEKKVLPDIEHHLEMAQNLARRS